MRLLVITPVYPPHRHGIGDYTHHLCTSWADKGHDVFVLTSHHCASEHKKDAVRIINSVTSWSIWNIFNIIREIERIKPHLISIQYESGAYQEKAAVNWLPLLLKIYCQGVPLLTTFHAFHGPAGFSKLNLLMLALFSDRLIVTHSEDYNKIKQRARFWLHKTRQIPIGSSLSCKPLVKGVRNKLMTKWGLAEDDFILCFFGFILPDKGLDAIISAIKILKEKGRSLKLLVIGGNPVTSLEQSLALEKLLKEQVASFHLEQSVIWTGFLESEEASQLMRLSSLGIMLYEDGLSLRRSTFMAYVCNFLPLITTPNTSPLPEHFQDGQSIIFTTYGKGAELAAKITVYMDNSEKLTAMRQRLREISIEYDWDVISDKQIDEYNQIINSRKQPRI